MYILVCTQTPSIEFFYPRRSSPVNVVVLLFSWRYNPLWLYFHSPVAGFSLLVFEVFISHTATRHSRQDYPGRVISPSQRPLPDNTQHSQQTNIHVPGGIRTYNLSRRAAEGLHLDRAATGTGCEYGYNIKFYGFYVHLLVYIIN